MDEKLIESLVRMPVDVGTAQIENLVAAYGEINGSDFAECYRMLLIGRLIGLCQEKLNALVG